MRFAAQAWTTGLACVLALGAAGTVHASPLIPFETPPSLVPAVGFWVRVYSQWPSTHVALHDAARVEVVYRVLDLSEFEPQPHDRFELREAGQLARKEALDAARVEVEDALRWLAVEQPESPVGLSGVRREAFVAWQAYGEEPERFEAAQSRVRAQRGLSDKYAAGYRAAGRFMGAVQVSLRDAGLPPELVALAFTESLMNVHARSSSGAVGLWQFLSGTGREYLTINTVVDERKDPILSTLAAGRYLRNSKDRLGSWGIAITAYNYGTNGMTRAVQQLGTHNVEVILRDYRTSRFGFAARNYYAEFLASLHVLSHADQYFAGTRPVAPWVFDVLPLPAETFVSELWAVGVDSRSLTELNPALTSHVLQGKVPLPRGFTLRVPRGKGPMVLRRLHDTGSQQTPAPDRHVVVRRGQTLHQIARKARVSLGALCAANGLDPHAPVFVGMRLKVPPPHVAFSVLPEAAQAIAAQSAREVTFSSAQSLPRAMGLLTGQRPGPEPWVVAFASTHPVPARPVAPARRRSPADLELTHAVVTVTADTPAPDLLQGARRVLRPVVSRSVPRGKGARVVAGPLWALSETDWASPAVDITAGAVNLPPIDVQTGAAQSSGWVLLPPQEMDVRTSAQPAG
jgi:membrane-bound lytic murein transglycosylase D